MGSEPQNFVGWSGNKGGIRYRAACAHRQNRPLTFPVCRNEGPRQNNRGDLHRTRSVALRRRGYQAHLGVRGVRGANQFQPPSAQMQPRVQDFQELQGRCLQIPSPKSLWGVGTGRHRTLAAQVRRPLGISGRLERGDCESHFVDHSLAETFPSTG